MESASRGPDGIPEGAAEADARLLAAARKDLLVFLGALFSRFGTRRVKGGHSVRTVRLLTVLGWAEASERYVPRRPSALRAALGIAGRATAAARDAAERCGALCGSFREGADTLLRLTGMGVSTSKLRKMTLAFGEACVAAQETPGPESFSCIVSGETIDLVTPLAKRHGLARGNGTVPRMLCLADGEPALEDALRDAFPHALFANDFAHASDHLHGCCLALGLEQTAAEKEYRFCRGLLYRIGAESAVKRLRRLHRDKLDASPEALRNLSYLEKRKDNMRYGWLRKNGYYIGSGHVEAAVRVLIVRRCKQAGMHWRHANAVCMAAIHAHYRSHHKAA